MLQLRSLLGAMTCERLSAAEAQAHTALDAAARALAAELRVAHDASAAACVRQREEAEACVACGRLRRTRSTSWKAAARGRRRAARMGADRRARARCDAS